MILLYDRTKVNSTFEKLQGKVQKDSQLKLLPPSFDVIVISTSTQEEMLLDTYDPFVRRHEMMADSCFDKFLLLTIQR